MIDAEALPAYDLGPGHPFARDRQKPLTDLIRKLDWLRDAERLLPAAAPRSELELAHAADYIAMVEATSAPEPDPEAKARGLAFGLGTPDNPLAPGQHTAASAVSGATAACVRAVASGSVRHAFNPTGGLHHAAHRAASGFCIYNDLVVAIHVARGLGLRRVLYVDFDVHHGDGVEFAFDHDPEVMTVSLHQSPETLFPGTGHETDVGHGPGRGSVVNMPFAPFTDDESWWHATSTLLPAVARRFRPDLILTQHGCDPHREDPLAQLSLTTAPMQRAARLSRELAEELCEGRWVATGGGGYQPYRVLPRAWALVWAEMSGREVPEKITRDWLKAWQHKSEAPLTESFLDTPASPTRAGRDARDANLRRLEQLLRVHEL